MIHSADTRYIVRYKTLSNNCNVAYIDEGKGPHTLLFIHGLATYAHTWQLQIEALKQHYRCIAIDLPGNGFSDRGNYPYGINFFSGCIYDFIQKMGLQRVTLVGHSMGGQIALNLVVNEPSVADKLILCAPAGFETFNSFERNIYQSSISFLDMFSTDENSLRRTIQSSFYHYPRQVDTMIEELISIMQKHSNKEYRQMVEACVNGMLNEPVFSKLHLIQQPTLIMYGERDALIPNRMIHPVNTRTIAEEGRRQIPNATLHMISQCGHFLQMEQPAEVNSYIRDFVN